MDRDIHFMKKAIALARKADGQTSPNPAVGALLVKNNKIIGRGYHRRAGLAHAEIEAFKSVRGDARGATLYVTLEPCCHFGKTGPCVDEIIRAQVKRVVVAVIDPNPRVRGKSIVTLRRAGIATDVGVLEAPARKLNEVFFTNMRRRRPFVVAKFAQSLDGKIATRTGQSQWVTGEPARNYAKNLRDRYDAVMVGVRTVIADDPQLNGIRKIPYKIILDPGLRVPHTAKLFRRHRERLIIVTDIENRKRVNRLPQEVKILFAKTRAGSFDLNGVLSALYKEGITSIFVEGGAETLGRFFDARLVDKVYAFIAPKIIGGAGARTAIAGHGPGVLKDAAALQNVCIERIDDDILISAYPQYAR